MAQGENMIGDDAERELRVAVLHVNLGLQRALNRQRVAEVTPGRFPRRRRYSRRFRPRHPSPGIVAGDALLGRAKQHSSDESIGGHRSEAIGLLAAVIAARAQPSSVAGPPSWSFVNGGRVCKTRGTESVKMRLCFFWFLWGRWPLATVTCWQVPASKGQAVTGKSFCPIGHTNIADGNRMPDNHRHRAWRGRCQVGHRL
jgi:hypothetical protein